MKMDVARNCRPCVCVEPRSAQKMRQLLESKGIWDSQFGLVKLGKNEVAIPVQEYMLDALQQEFQCTGNIPYRLSREAVPPSKKMTIVTPRERLIRKLKELIEGAGLIWTQDVDDDVPKQWEKHGDLVLLPDLSFRHEVWESIDPACLWEEVSKSLRVSRVAKKGTIRNNNFRSPRVQLLLGDDGWVEQTDNGIRFTYDITHCMFSSGNITEKLRVARFDCRGETVVDLYAGIGYFTLPYLVHAKALMVHACEWNPDALRALQHNLRLNKVDDRCVVHAGDNAKVCPQGIADRVNLGLIPNSEQGWPIACAALKPAGGILHIHGNVTTTPQHVMDCSRLQIKNHEHDEKDKTKLTVGGASHCNPDDTSDSKVHRAGHDLYKSTEMRKKPINVACENFEENNLPVLQNTTKLEKERRMHQIDYRTTDLPEQVKGQHGELHGVTEQCDDEKYTNTLLSTHNASVSFTRKQWCKWAENVAGQIKSILEELHDGKAWKVDVIHVEHVKSYAPHVDHIVADVDCRPS